VYQDTNNYTLDHQHQSHHMTMPRYQQEQQQIQQMSTPLHKTYTNSSAGTLLNGSSGGGGMYNYRQAPPAYFPEPVDTANYSSATTATPSPPRSTARLQTIGAEVHRTQQQPASRQVSSNNRGNQQRPLSEHIYSSIDSDYGALDCENQLLQQQRLVYGEHQTAINDFRNGSMASPVVVAPVAWRAGNTLQH
jgi:hypothetical protein